MGQLTVQQLLQHVLELLNDNKIKLNSPIVVAGCDVVGVVCASGYDNEKNLYLGITNEETESED